jgi:hypothetical protein
MRRWSPSAPRVDCSALGRHLPRSAGARARPAALAHRADGAAPLEARGEIRGGRFVDGFVGEQFALPEAVDALRSVRRRRDGGVVVVSAADPLNLVGLVTPGARISPFSGMVLAYRDGLPVEIGELGAIRSRLQTPAG